MIVVCLTPDGGIYRSRTKVETWSKLLPLIRQKIVELCKPFKIIWVALIHKEFGIILAFWNKRETFNATRMFCNMNYNEASNSYWLLYVQ